MDLVSWETRGHKLKVWPEYFEALIDGTKTAEVRKDDRDYKVGDLLHLREWNPETESYTGREAAARVTHLVRGPHVPDGYVLLSLGRIAAWWVA